MCISGSKMKALTVTVVGGSGFVGTNFCRLLLTKKVDFEIIDLQASEEFPSHYKFGDVRDAESLEKAITGDLVVNLAAVHVDNSTKEQYEATNIEGARNLASVCIAKGIHRILFTSSVAVYGFSSSRAIEGAPKKPFNAYGSSKLAAEGVFENWFNENQAEHQLTIVRPTVIFGEGNRGNVYNMLKRVADRRFVMVGSGQNKKSMAYVKNIVSFLWFCIERPSGFEIYNYTDGPDFDMNTLVQTIHQGLGRDQAKGVRLPKWFGLLVGRMFDVKSLIVGKKSEISHQRIKKFTESTEFSSDKKDATGFVPPFSLREGLLRTIDNEFLNRNPQQQVFYTE